MASPPKSISIQSLFPSANLSRSLTCPETTPSMNIEAKNGGGNAICLNRKIGIVLDEVSKVTSSTSIPSADHFKASSLPPSPAKGNLPRSLEQLRAEILKMRNPCEGKTVLDDHNAPRLQPKNAVPISSCDLTQKTKEVLVHADLGSLNFQPFPKMQGTSHSHPLSHATPSHPVSTLPQDSLQYPVISLHQAKKKLPLLKVSIPTDTQ